MWDKGTVLLFPSPCLFRNKRTVPMLLFNRLLFIATNLNIYRLYPAACLVLIYNEFPLTITTRSSPPFRHEKEPIFSALQGFSCFMCYFMINLVKCRGQKPPTSYYPYYNKLTPALVRIFWIQISSDYLPIL